MLESVRELERRLTELEKALRSVRSVQIDRADIRSTAREAVDFYFRVVREPLVNSRLDSNLVDACDKIAHKVLEDTHRRTTTTAYRTHVKAFHRCAVDTEKVVLLASQGADGKQHLDPTDKRIIETLGSLLPSAALSYEQAALDLMQPSRLSWRGPATDLREALRETLDHLAPDRDVTGQPGFKLESGTTGPTMKQKVRFILRKRGVSTAAMATPEAAAAAVDEAVGTFVRSVYARSSVSTHTPTDRREVLRIRDWVRTALCELLAI
jgi:hypothetical protein